MRYYNQAGPAQHVLRQTSSKVCYFELHGNTNIGRHKLIIDVTERGMCDSKWRGGGLAKQTRPQRRELNDKNM